MFQGQLGLNMKAYVDDILVKSSKMESYVVDLEETLAIMRKYMMRLNPAKYFFGDESWEVLGMVTERGIEVNPLKVKENQEMSPPRTLKKTQYLTGRIVVLRRFVSHLAYCSLPIYKVLRKCGTFVWTIECQG